MLKYKPQIIKQIWTMSLFVTDTAAQRIQTFLDKKPDAKGFKINIKKTGDFVMKM